MRIANAALRDGHHYDLDVTDGVIVSVTPAGTTSTSNETINVDGRRVVAGLWDEHVHVRAWAMSTRRPSVRDATSPEQVVAAVRSALATATPGVPLVVTGMRDGLWHALPARSLLDEIAPHHAVMVVSSDLHSTWSNQALGALLGIELDATGMLREAPSFDAMTRVDAMLANVADEWVTEEIACLGARGVVGVVDLDFADAVGAWARRPAAGIRVDAGVYPHDLDAAVDRGLRTGDQIKGLARVGPMKVITDGSLGTRTAFCHAPYPGTSNYGQLEVPTGQLTALLATAKAANLTPAVHAIGDAANTLAIDAFEAVGVQGRIEHAQLLSAHDVSRMAALGITASIQPEHMLDDRELVAKYWAAQSEDAYRIRSLLAAGVHVVFGSDAPVTPLDPWLAISAAVTRSRGDEAAWQQHEAVDIETALAISARTRIAVGQPADIVALGAELEPGNVARMPVDLTLVAGAVTHASL